MQLTSFSWRDVLFTKISILKIVPETRPDKGQNPPEILNSDFKFCVCIYWFVPTFFIQFFLPCRALKNATSRLQAPVLWFKFIPFLHCVIVSLFAAALCQCFPVITLPEAVKVTLFAVIWVSIVIIFLFDSIAVVSRVPVFVYYFLDIFLSSILLRDILMSNH